ncbi:MAG: methanogen output domain 1-containing protein [Planctomycetaceae bacterium]
MKQVEWERSISSETRLEMRPRSTDNDDLLNENSFAHHHQTGAEMNESSTPPPAISELAIPLERDVFLRNLLRHLAGTLQNVVGLQEASGFVSVVGQEMGEEINRTYKTALAVSSLSRQQVGEVLVDLKRRIQGDFYVIEEDDDEIVLGNRACPFGEKVIDRHALCMMTSNVFGSIAADNLGYSKVVIEQAIARGDAGCRVVVYLKPTPEAQSSTGREYFKG